jgi:glycosyltransferase involved in cell wall biosynthesis
MSMHSPTRADGPDRDGFFISKPDRSLMCCPPLNELPPPPLGRTGWPWTEGFGTFPENMPDNSPWPSISIVTPSYNQGDFLEETIRSVLLQGYPNLEYLVIDGGSTDCSLDIIKKYEPWLTSWVSEPDRGQAHAINKGLERCTGRIFNWVNSDDILAPNALTTIALRFGDHDGVAGAVLNFDDAGGHREIIKNLIKESSGASFHQPGLWLIRENVAICGGLDESLHFTFDWDLAMRYLANFPSVCYTDDVLVYFRLHDRSKTVSARSQFDAEQLRVCAKILAEPTYARMHSYCSMRLRQNTWWSQLERTADCPEYSLSNKLFRILFGALADPPVRLTRLTAGTIKRLILGR